MKKDINLDEILDNIVVKKAPDDLIYRWKAEVSLRKRKHLFFSVLSSPSVLIALVFACVWYCFLIIKPYLYDYNLFSKIFSFIAYFLQIPGNIDVGIFVFPEFKPVNISGQRGINRLAGQCGPVNSRCKTNFSNGFGSIQK